MKSWNGWLVGRVAMDCVWQNPVATPRSSSSFFGRCDGYTAVKIRPIQWRKDGFGLKLVDLPDVRQNPEARRLPFISPMLKAPIRCRYWQIWTTVNGENRVVDRATTKKKAIERIRRMKNAGAPLILQEIK